MPVGKPLHLRLFLEGEEVPVISAQISINTSAPATAAIQVLPLDSALDLLPRTMVHLFFLDTKVDKGEPLLLKDGTHSGTYRLLFSGEFVSFAYSQTPSSRGLVLQCMDFSNYWDSVNVMAISYGPNGNAFTNDGSVNGASLGMFTDIPGDSAAEHLVTWVRSHPVTQGLTGVGGLAGGVIHIMEAMGGVPGHFKGVNDFYTVAELRCRLLNQITAEEDDNTASRVLAVVVFKEWLKNGIEQAGGNITFRDVMKLLFQYIYYEFVPNPAPKFDDSSTNKIQATQDSALEADPKIGGIRSSLTEILWKMQAFSSLLGDNSNFTQKTILTSAEAYGVSLTAIKKKLDAYTKKSKEAKKASGFVQQAVSALSRLRLTDTTSGPAFQAAIEAVQKALDTLESGTIQGSATSVAFSSQRLRTQIVRPDCWFSSPPACNVMFPEMYAQISYDRNFLQEPTRLLVHTFNTLIGRDHLMANHILAPFIGLNAQALAKYKGSQSFRILMDHEIHVGILPKTEWIPNTANIGQSLDAKQLAKVSNGRLDWTIKASLFHFFKYRFAARQVSVAGRFNPFLVCGFPGAVITRPYVIKGGAAELRKNNNGQPVPDSKINDVINDHADAFHAPAHFMGMIGAIQHSIDQSGGTTQVTLHHARKHRGSDDEFISLLRKTTEGSAKKIVKVVLDVNTAQEMALAGNTKPLALLLGVTPQAVETPGAAAPAAKPTKFKATVTITQAKKVNPTAKDIGAVLRSGLAPLNLPSSVFGATQVSETDSSSARSSAVRYPPRTKNGSIQEVNRPDILVPFGATKIKVNDKKGLYGGRIVGIEVLDANTEPVSFDTFSKVTTDVGATGDQGQSLVVSRTTKSVKSNTRGVVFSTVCVYEEVTYPASGNLPIEEILRPSWFSTSYANQNIGDKIYKPFFGCDSVVGGLTVAGAAPQSADATPDAESVDASESIGDLSKRLEAAEASKRSMSIEKALNILGYEYGQVKSQGMDVDSFIREYTNRPIATYRDIFGDPNLTFSVTSSAVGGDAKVNDQTDANGVSKTPRIGFHTGATHPDLVGTVAKGGKLIGLTTDLQLGFKRVGGIGATDPIVTQYDVRPAKKAAVMAYLAELEMGPGFLGG